MFKKVVILCFFALSSLKCKNCIIQSVHECIWEELADWHMTVLILFFKLFKQMFKHWLWVWTFVSCFLYFFFLELRAFHWSVIINFWFKYFMTLIIFIFFDCLCLHFLDNGIIFEHAGKGISSNISPLFLWVRSFLKCQLFKWSIILKLVSQDSESIVSYNPDI